MSNNKEEDKEEVWSVWSFELKEAQLNNDIPLSSSTHKKPSQQKLTRQISDHSDLTNFDRYARFRIDFNSMSDEI